MTREEAIERIKSRYDKWALDDKDLEAIQCTFPELRESEDERIRKALVNTFEKKLENGFEWIEFGIPNRAVLAWLEKKKEQKPSISCGHENDIEWSEEDEKMLYFVNQFLEYHEASDPTAKSCKEWFNNRLKSLRPQPKEELNKDWELDDHTMLGNILGTYRTLEEMLNLETGQDRDILESMNWEREWLVKRLSAPKSHWKPTDEQMKKLNIAISCYEGDWGEDNAKPLRELYEELKKL